MPFWSAWGGSRTTAAKISLIIKKLTLSYSHWFNGKYDRSGYLFQGRFRSEPVEDDAYLAAVLRYIHNNPVEVGKDAGRWTSYDSYLEGSALVDADLALAVYSDSPEKARALFREHMAQCPEDGPKVRLAGGREHVSDSDAAEMIKHVGGVPSCSKLGGLDRERLNQALAGLKDAGLSVRQIARLTGINRGVVQKAREQQCVAKRGNGQPPSRGSC